jgi:PAS domain S-box-containing protein
MKFMGMRCWVWVFLAWLAAGSVAHLKSADPVSPGRNVATTIQEFYALTEEEATGGVPVRIQAVVTYVDPDWNMLCIQEKTGGTYVNLQGLRPGCEVSDLVLVEGLTSMTNGFRRIQNLSVGKLDQHKMPMGIPATADELLSGKVSAQVVRVRGVVRGVRSEDRLFLNLQMDSKRFQVCIKRYLPSDLPGLIDARVRLEGVCLQDYNDRGEVVGAKLFVGGFRNFHLEEPGSAEPFAAPVQPVKRLAESSAKTPGTQRIRVQGIVQRQPNTTSIWVSDATGTVRAEDFQNLSLQTGQRVELIGFPRINSGEWVMEDALFRVMDSVKSTVPTEATETAAQRPLPVLKKAKDILRLKPEQARERYPVKLTGVVTYFDSLWQNLFVQDDTGGIYVEPGDQKIQLALGQKVEITGVTDPGGFLPMVVKTKIALIGQGQLPTPVAINYQQGTTAAYDCQWVEVQGIVHSTELQENHVMLDLAADDGHFLCWVPTTLKATTLTNLINAVVRVQGVCAVVMSEARLLTGLSLRVPGESSITVVEQPFADPFQAPLCKISEVLRVLPPDIANRHLRIQGTVTLVRPHQGLYLQDQSAGIYLRTFQTNGVQVGDEVEAVGFRGLGEFTPILREGAFRILKSGSPPLAKPLSAESVLRGEHNAQLVQVEGRLIDSVPALAAPEFLVQDGAVLFQVATEVSANSSQFDSVQAGSVLRLTGICHILAGESRQPKSFRLLLRSPADLVVLQRPPWLNPQRILAAAGLLTTLTLMTLGWVVALRRRVRLQTDHIRQRLQREAALEDRYQQLFENAHDVIFAHGLTGRFQAVNRAGEALLGYQPGELLHMGLDNIVASDHRERLRQRLQDNLNLQNTVPYEIDVITKGGQRRTLEISTRLIRVHNEPAGMESIARDVTEKRNLEMRLRQSEKMESVGQLAAGVAHDFNNLLTVIHGHANLLQADHRLPDDLVDSTHEITASAQRAAELTRQLLAFSRRQLIQPRLLDLNDTVRNVARMLQRLLGEHIVLRLDYAADLPSIKADPGMMEQIIINLSVNARDAMPKGGHLQIQTAAVELDARRASCINEARPGRFVRLTVKDSGMGMNADTMTHLFEPFFTTKEVGKGTGLGLATVYGICHQHDGWITVSSQLEQGSTFDIYLPVDGAPIMHGNTDHESANHMARRHTVLVVEDEPRVLRLAAQVLRRHGYHTIEAASGKAALERWSADGASVDVLLTDLVMPGGVTGIDLGKSLSQTQPSLKVVYTSGYSPELAGYGVELRDGVNFLSKPYTPSALLRIIANSLETASPKDSMQVGSPGGPPI